MALFVGCGRAKRNPSALPITVLLTLPRTVARFTPIPRPIHRQYPRLYIPMKRRPRPVGDPFHITVLTRVVMDVIHMPGKVFFITDAVFPEAALPDATFAFALSAGRN